MENRYNRCYTSAAARPFRRRRFAQAFTLIEVLFAIFILLIMALMFGAVSVSATRSSRFGNSYNQAMSLAQHKIDQLQDAGYTKAITPTKLYGTEIDDPNVNYGGGNSPAPTLNGTLPAANSRFVGYFTNVDKLNQYFVAQKDSGNKFTANSAQGMVEITPYIGTGGAAATNLKIKITITWQDTGYAKSTYITEAVLTRDSSL